MRASEIHLASGVGSKEPRILALEPATGTRLKEDRWRRVLNYITSPALMMIQVADTDLHAVLGIVTRIALIPAALSGGLYVVVSRCVLHRDGQRTAVGAMSASYVNAGNIGLTFAVYAIGSSAPVLSVLLAPLLVIAPLYLALFTWLSERHDGGSLA